MSRMPTHPLTLAIQPLALTLALVLLPVAAGAQRTRTPDATLKLNITAPFSITSVSGTTVRAKNAQGEVIEFRAQPQVAQYLNVGQDVRADQTLAHFAVFPITKSKRDHVGQGDWMDTDVKVSNTGRMDGKTRTWTTACQDGFTGGMMVYLLDRQGNVLVSTSKIRKYGVNGTCIPGASSEQKDSWYETFDVALINKVAKVSIVHLKAPTNRIDDFLARAKTVAEIVQTGAETYQTVSGAGATSGAPRSH
jgi:hypothetical protein